MAGDLETYFAGSTLSRDLLDLIKGDRLGEGSARQVFRYALHDDLVVKFETGAASFQNAVEWELWGWAKDTPMERWLAPCRRISACGTILIQDRCEPLPKRLIPKKLPAFLNDTKVENFGVLKGRVVCCDYGIAIAAIRRSSRRMVKASWT